MKKLLPLMLLVPCIAFGANSHQKASVATGAKTGTSLTVPNAAAVKGVVKDETGAPLAGVSVVVKGTSSGTQTDINGKFTLNASPGDVLVFSYIGYVRQTVTVGSSAITVTLLPNSKDLNEVVVTALGITKTSASLSYSQQTVSGKELEVAKDASFVNSLSGKVSGLQISASSSGAGGSTKVVLRGNKSIFGSSSVLYVVDGIPLNSLTSGQPSGIFSGMPDGGDGISNINPDDIESISVLKGASASALYGSDAANGVILITTKKGKAGKTVVTLNSNETWDKATQIPTLQTEYAQGNGGTSNTTSFTSWGAKETGGAPNGQPSQYFVTGKGAFNSFTLSTGTDKNQTFISYANTHDDGVQPGNTFNRHNITLNNTTKLLNDKMTLDFSGNYITQNSVDRPGEGSYFNPLSSVYLFPRGMDFNQYKNFQVFDPTRNLYIDNWFQPVASNADYFENPYWIQYRNPVVLGLNRLLATISAKYDINSWLNIQGRVKLDATNTTSDQRLYAGSNLLFSSTTGHYTYGSNQQDQVYSDLLLNANKDLSRDFNINGTLGASITDGQYSGTGFNDDLGVVTNYFNESNLAVVKSHYPFTQTNKTESQSQALFATVDLGYKKYLFLDVTGRNDWNSALAFTTTNSFFYPSVGLSDVLSSMFKMPEAISYAKIRASYTIVGNSIPNFISTDPAQSTLSGGTVSLSQSKPFGDLKPEKTHSFEIGTEWRFFNDHLTFDATYYHTNTYNQLFNPNESKSSQYSNFYVNGGNVENKGFEGSLGYNGKIGGLVQWNSTVTFSLNRNKIISLYTNPITGEVVKQFIFGNSFDSYSNEARVGYPFGEIFAADFQKDASGKIVVNGDGTTTSPYKPAVQGGSSLTWKDVGNSNPDYLLGWTNAFKVKNFDLAFTIDGRFGGKVLDETGAYMDSYGTSIASAQLRDAGGITISGKHINAQDYFQTIGSRQGALAEYAYSATNIRLREASFGYTIPGSVFNNKISSIRVALTGRNLFFFYLKAPFDPETILATDNTLAGLQLFGQPSVRTIGFNVSARF
jgi:TonB-linked SusC/RagA family outer membrane protein